MGADRIIYCLEQLTDYDQFERLCTDLMGSEGYKGIEPLGGSKDKGRDALHTSRSTGESTIFAYSVREDWRAKLVEDSAKIKKHGHKCDRLIFLSTATFTANERDEAVGSVSKAYGWHCDLYGIERIRHLLATAHTGIIAHHPHIFVPQFFPVAGGLVAVDCHDHILIDHVDSDAALAEWLFRRLTLAGYFVWCRGLAPLAGASVSESMRRLITSRAAHYISILSPQSVADPDATSRRSFALGNTRQHPFVIPAVSRAVDVTALDQDTRRLSGIDFSYGWAQGLKMLQQVLEAANCPRKPQFANQIALNSYLQPDLVTNEPETLSSNLFVIESLPSVIYRFHSRTPIGQADHPITQKWAFRHVSDTHFLSFEAPQPEFAKEFGFIAKGGSVWKANKQIDEINSTDLVKELIKKSLTVECIRRGMCYCAEKKLVYFPENLLKNEFLRYRDADGNARSFTVTGERAYGRGTTASKFKYQVAPVFVPIGSADEGFEILLRIRVRLTNSEGQLFAGHSGNARRKKLCKSWWNADWLSRTKGVMQFLSGDDGVVTIGLTVSEAITINSHPRTWVSPMRLNESALGSAMDKIEEEFRESMEPEDEEDEVSDE